MYQKQFIYAVTISFAFGVGLSSIFDISLFITTWLVLIGVGLFLINKKTDSDYSNSLKIFCAGLLFCALGMSRMYLEKESYLPDPYDNLLETEVTIEGVIVVEPDVRESTTHLTIETEAIKILAIVERYSQVEYGDLVQVTGTLKKPTSFATDYDRIFLYPEYLRARGIDHTMSFSEVKVLESGHGNYFMTKLYEFKKSFMDVTEGLYREPYAGLGEGLLLGVKQALGDELEQDFRRAGIIHIVVLSGYNIMLVVLFVMYVLSFLLPFRMRMVVGIMSIISFALLVGLSATVVRASLMASLLLLSKLLDRQYLVMRALFLAGFIMLMINPYLLLYDVGFQLSFLATLGLLLCSERIGEWLSSVPTWLGIREFLVATLVTQVFVAPLILYQIGELSLVAVIVNVLVLPMVPVAMLLVFISGLVGMISVPLALPFVFLGHYSLLYIVTISQWFAASPFASVIAPVFSIWWLIILYGIIGVVVLKILKIESGKQALAGWTIVEEETIVADESRSDSSATNTPVFFR